MGDMDRQFGLVGHTFYMETRVAEAARGAGSDDPSVRAACSRRKPPAFPGLTKGQTMRAAEIRRAEVVYVLSGPELMLQRYAENSPSAFA